jgi:probable HAF family extracellular repeat protein
VKKFAKVLVAVGLVSAFSSLALGQHAFNIVKVPNASANTSTAINNAGQVVVNSGAPPASNVSLWNRLAGIQSLSLTGVNNVGVAINAGNDVAGVGAPGSSGQLQAFLWRAGGGTQWLGTLGGVLSAATGINAARNVVGMSYTAANQQHAFLWSEAGGMQDLTPSLTSLGGATAMGINTPGQAIGYYYPNGATNAVGFSWTQDGGLQSFGTPGTLGMAINDAGTIVGRELTAGGYWHAFSRTPAGAIADLGTLGGSMSTALGINNKGWIVGTSLAGDKSGLLHGFLWTPSGGMQDFAAVSGLGKVQVYSVQVNDHGDIAFTTGKQLVVLVPNITAKAVSSANPSPAGQAVTITVTLSSIAGPPPNGETLQFLVAGKTVGSGTIGNGVAQCTISGLSAGSHVIAVTYAGDAYYLPFRYTPITQVVNP